MDGSGSVDSAVGRAMAAAAGRMRRAAPPARGPARVQATACFSSFQDEEQFSLVIGQKMFALLTRND